MRAFDYAQANGNLTEFGGAYQSTAGLCTRSLFKDGLGNPITITKTSSEQLVITYDIEFTCSPTVSTAATPITITGIGSKNVNVAFAKGIGRKTSSDGNIFGAQAYLYIHKTALDMNYTSMSVSVANTYATGSPTMPYVNGTFYRDITHTAPADSVDATIYGYSLGSYDASSGHGLAFKVEFAAPIAKNKDYKLTLTIRLSVARA